VAHKEKMTLVRIRPEIVRAFNIAAAAKGIKPWVLFERVCIHYLKDNEPKIWDSIKDRFSRIDDINGEN
jgi:hypothetical protein